MKIQRAVAAMSLFMLAGTALAVPAIVDRVPENAMLTIAVPNLEKLEKNVQSVATLLGMPAGQLSVDSVLAMAGVQGGLTKSGPMAMFVLPPKDPKVSPEPAGTAILVSTSDYKALLKNFNVTPSGGVDKAEINGDEVFMKDLGGGIVALGPDKAYLDSFAGKGGNSAGFKKMLGAAADKLSESSDICVILNMDSLRPMAKMAVAQGIENMEANMPGGEQMESMTETVKYVTDMILDDSKAAVFGVSIDNMGISMNMVNQFNDGSRLGKAAAAPGKSSELLAKLPTMPYLMAFALDLSSPDLKKIIKDMPKPKGADGTAPAASAIDWKASLDKGNGMSMTVGVSPAGIMGGLLTRTVMYQACSDTTAAMADYRKVMDKMKADDLAETTYVEGATEIGGTKVDSFEMRMKPDDENPMAAQVMTFMFGLTGGPTGYIVKADGGLISTYSKASDLMESAMKSAKGEGSMTKEKVLAQVSEKLPPGRIAEGYLGVKGILDSVMPLMAMAGINAKIDVPENLPPIAMGMAAKDGAMTTTFYMPAPTLKTIADTVKTVQNAQQGGGGPRGGQGGQPADKKPKF